MKIHFKKQKPQIDPCNSMVVFTDQEQYTVCNLHDTPTWWAEKHIQEVIHTNISFEKACDLAYELNQELERSMK